MDAQQVEVSTELAAPGNVHLEVASSHYSGSECDQTAITERQRSGNSCSTSTPEGASLNQHASLRKTSSVKSRAALFEAMMKSPPEQTSCPVSPPRGIPIRRMPKVVCTCIWSLLPLCALVYAGQCLGCQKWLNLMQVVMITIPKHTVCLLQSAAKSAGGTESITSPWSTHHSGQQEVEMVDQGIPEVGCFDQLCMTNLPKFPLSTGTECLVRTSCQPTPGQSFAGLPAMYILCNSGLGHTLHAHARHSGFKCQQPMLSTHCLLTSRNRVSVVFPQPHMSRSEAPDV